MRSESLISSPPVSSPLIRLDSFDSTTEGEIRRQQTQQQQLLDGANRKLQSQMERGRRRTNSLRGEERDSTASEDTEGGVESEISFESEGDQDSKTPIPEWVLGAAPRNSLCGYKKRMLGSTVEEPDSLQDSRI